jgi:hypothetical protein
MKLTKPRTRTIPLDSYPDCVSKANRQYYHALSANPELLNAVGEIVETIKPFKGEFLVKTGIAFKGIGLEKANGEPLGSPQVSLIRKLAISMLGLVAPPRRAK